MPILCLLHFLSSSPIACVCVFCVFACVCVCDQGGEKFLFFFADFVPVPSSSSFLRQNFVRCGRLNLFCHCLLSPSSSSSPLLFLVCLKDSAGSSLLSFEFSPSLVPYSLFPLPLHFLFFVCSSSGSLFTVNNGPNKLCLRHKLSTFMQPGSGAERENKIANEEIALGVSEDTDSAVSAVSAVATKLFWRLLLFPAF